MSKQVYFSFIIAALSFITVKKIQEVGVEQYQIFASLFQKEDGWFNFKQPDFILNLPFELREISGISSYADNEIACVQDKNGTIFIYNLESDSIIHQFQFASSGTFEGMTRVDSTYYILQGDATMIELKYPYDSTSCQRIKLGVNNLNNEGLCIDQRGNRLLLAPKTKINKGKENKDLVGIYAINLDTKRIENEAVFYMSIAEIEAFANERNIPLPQKINKAAKDSVSALKFEPTSIAVHPRSDEIYILSSVDQSIIVYDKEGKLQNFMRLDPTMISRPKRIVFLANGDLVITNDNPYGKPTLIKFHWQKLTGEE